MKNCMGFVKCMQCMEVFVNSGKETSKAGYSINIFENIILVN